MPNRVGMGHWDLKSTFMHPWQSGHPLAHFSHLAVQAMALPHLGHLAHSPMVIWAPHFAQAHFASLHLNDFPQPAHFNEPSAVIAEQGTSFPQPGHFIAHLSPFMSAPHLTHLQDILEHLTRWAHPVHLAIMLSQGTSLPHPVHFIVHLAQLLQPALPVDLHPARPTASTATKTHTDNRFILESPSATRVERKGRLVNSSLPRQFLDDVSQDRLGVAKNH